MSAVSLPTAKITPSPPVNVKPPTITGTAQQGKTLTEVHGEWTNEPESYEYKWERCDKPAGHALKSPARPNRPTC